MAEIFLKIVNMSISAGWIVLAVLLARLLFKKAPKWITVLLWGVVALRLICPFSIESAISLIPSAQTVSPGIMMEQTPQINSGIPVIDDAVNPGFSETFAPDVTVSANPLQIWIPILACVWVAGMAALLAYTVFSCLRVRKMIGTAVRLRENVFQSETVATPFVFGVIQPRIYLPFAIDARDMEHVIAHEQAHIHRRDYLWKPLGFLLLTVHWFNPLIWLGYVLLCKDIELACDEKVIKEYTPCQKADYSQALLSCSTHRRIIAACPIAFGEVSVKDRVKAVLSYKKPAFWIIIAAVVATAVVAVCFLTNPISKENDQTPQLLRVKVGEKWGLIDSTGRYVVEPKYDIIDDFDEDGMASVRLNGKWGRLDSTGQVVVEPKYDGMYDYKTALIPVLVNDKWGCVDRSGNLVIEPKYEYAPHFRENGTALILEKGNFPVFEPDIGPCRFGYIDTSGQYIVKPQYMYAGEFHEDGWACVCLDGKWGYIDVTGSYVIQPQFDGAQDFSSAGYARIKQNGKYGFIDRTGKIVVEPIFSQVDPLEAEGLTRAKIRDLWGFIDNTGKVVIDAIFEYVGDFREDGLCVVKRQGFYGMINKSGEYVVQPKFAYVDTFSDNGLAMAMTDFFGERGYIDRSGEFVILPRFDTAGRFDAAGMAVVERDDKWGVIDETGYYVIAPKYDYIGTFDANGLALAKTGDKWGVINREGEYVISPQFDRMESFADNGLAAVQVDGKWGYIDTTGRFVIRPQFTDIGHKVVG